MPRRRAQTRLAARRVPRRSKAQPRTREMSTLAHPTFNLAGSGSFVGRELGVSEWITIDQGRIDQFAACTGDHQWLHVDVERSRRESPYGGPIAHGFLTLSLLAPTAFDVFIRPAGIKQAFNYGLERVRFITPVKAGARVRNRIGLLSVEERGAEHLLLRTENKIEIEAEEKPAMLAVALVLVERGHANGRQPMGATEQAAIEADASQRLVDNATEGMLGPNPFIGFRPQDITAAFGELARQAVQHPAMVLAQEAALLRELMAILSGGSKLAAAPGDKRFTDAAWQENPLYRICLQTYLAWTNSVAQFVDQSALDQRTKQRVRFAASLLTDALAPTNTLFGNPAALRSTLASGGANLLAGLKNMLADMATNGSMPSQVDKGAFKVGENLALSKGAVVLTTPVLELIQYSPTSGTVHARPHLIVPPQINKFYFFDLSPGRSIVEYLTQNQFQVFAISWRNPTAAERDWDMQTYVAAIREAIETITDITNSPDVIVHAACSGAMTATILAAVLAARREPLIHAMTLMVAVLGGNPDTQLGLFSTPEVIAAAKLETMRRGVLEGDEMSRVFAWMRPNDLIWSYWTNNYLMGNPPPAFDILYWNNDTTRLPAKFHGTLIDIFTNDSLLHPGQFKVLGVPVDVSQIACDKFIVAGLTDHITPWRDGYRMARALGGKNEFVLSSSGHIQTLINPIGGAKGKYFVNPTLVPRADDWLSQAKPVAGSWWEHWRAWLAERSGEIRAAPARLGNDRYPRGADAPGTYASAG